MLTCVKHAILYVYPTSSNRLRDISQETEQENRRRIAEMEHDVATLDELQSEHPSLDGQNIRYLKELMMVSASFEETLIKLANAETQVDDLKAQLDDALGAEDLLVQLTERNLVLGEVCLTRDPFLWSVLTLYVQKIEEMRITIEDLEALKELNDELEENHVETEKAMQEDLGGSFLT